VTPPASGPATGGTRVDGDGVTFLLADPHRRLTEVRLMQEIGLDVAPFTRVGPRWTLRVARPPVDRMEYLFEIEDVNGRRATITDPANPRRAPGAFGEKSVLEFPGYRAPAWLEAPAPDGVSVDFEIDAPRLDGPLSGMVWAPADLDPAAAAPLLVVHDGPEFATLGSLLRYVSASIAAGALPPLRAALLGPGDRNVWYSANPDYAEALALHVLPTLPPATVRVGIGVSLGALAMLHAHRTQGGCFDAMFLQSGSYFTPDLDAQESTFSGWEPVTGFVADTHAADRDERPVPTVLTCGLPEENLANNKRMEATLARLGYRPRLTVVRDSHNFTAWRDALHPHLADLVTGVVAAHAA
jgi:enterochelin esterase-like enzyme